jgi:hypothetical protein
MCNLSESQEGKKASQIFEGRCKSFEERLLEEQQKQNQKIQKKLCGMDRLSLPRGFEADTFTPTYDQVIAAGFKREIASDDVFEQQHGYAYFLVNFEVYNLIIEWDVLSHELTLTVAHQLIGRITFDKAKAIIEELDRPKQD